MYRPNLEQLMILITSVDENACIKYSTVTGQFYVSNRIWRMMENYNYQNTNEHRDTIDEAIRACYTAIQGKLVKLDNTSKAYKLPKLIA